MKKRIFAILLILSILISLSGCCTLFKRAVKQNADALKIGDHTISAVELNYFYIDAINDFVNQYGDYISLIGLDTSKSLNQQIYDKDSNETWADHFLATAIDKAKNTYALYEAAVSASHTLTNQEQASIQQLMDNLEVYSDYYGYVNTNQYMAAVYGEGATTESYAAYYQVVTTASSYYAAYADDLRDSYTPSSLRNFEGEESYKYNSYSYASCFLSAKDYPADEIETLAQKLASPDNNTYYQLSIACKELLASNLPTKYENRLYSVIPAPLQDWLSSADRKTGDITAVRSENSGGQLQGYYVVLYLGVRDNQFSLANVRHILVAYEGGLIDSQTGLKTYTAEEKKKAKDEVKKIYMEWLDGAKTEDSFAELARMYTDDSNGDQGGLYEDIFPGQMVDPFNDWCFAADRKAGDHSIIETEYGWHIMFYSGDSDTTYRDYMVANDKQAIDIEAWNEALVDNISIEILNTKFVNKEYIISSML